MVKRDSLSNERNVQVSDTTGVDSSSEAGYTIITILIVGRTN